MALEAISSWEEIALQFQNHQIRGREPFYGLSLHQLRPVQTKATNQCEQKSQVTAIRCSIDFCVMLCNEQAKKQKNTAQTRHSCALFDALSIFVQCCATRRRSTRSRLGFRTLLLCAVPQQLVWPLAINTNFIRSSARNPDGHRGQTRNYSTSWHQTNGRIWHDHHYGRTLAQSFIRSFSS